MVLEKYWMSRGFRILFFLYLLLLAKMILVKHLPPAVILERIAAFDWRAVETNLVMSSNFVPFRTIAGYLSGEPNLRIGLENVLGNLIGFVPFGILFPLSCPKWGNGRRVATAAFVASLAFEAAQLFLRLGSFDADDLLLNTSGAMLGFAAFKIFLRPLSGASRFSRPNRGPLIPGSFSFFTNGSAIFHALITFWT